MLRKKDNKKLPQCPDSLAHELESLGRMIRDYGCKDCADLSEEENSRLMAVARVCSDLPLTEWQSLVSNPEYEQWIAFPLSAELYPYLVKIQEKLDKLSYQSDHDALTGLHNRRAFERVLSLEHNRAHRQGGRMSLAVLDIDHFKSVNDTYGHACGDTVIKGLADLLATSKRTYDLAARIGGEEFALVLPGVGANRARTMVSRILKLFRGKTFYCDDEEFTATFSAGVASIKGVVKTSSSELFDMADKALYEAKEQGRNQVVARRTKDELEMPKRTMVRSEEKQFLFSGTK